MGVKNCLSIVLGALYLLSNLVVLLGIVLVATDVSHGGKWGFLAGSLVLAAVLGLLFRLTGHRVRDAYGILEIFSW